MSVLPPAETYRTLARRMREEARTKTDRYAQRVLHKKAELYDKLADQIEQMGRGDRDPTPPGEPAR